MEKEVIYERCGFCDGYGVVPLTDGVGIVCRQCKGSGHNQLTVVRLSEEVMFAHTNSTTAVSVSIQCAFCEGLTVPCEECCNHREFELIYMRYSGRRHRGDLPVVVTPGGSIDYNRFLAGFPERSPMEQTTS